MTIAKQSHAGCHISSSSPIALNWAGLAQQKCTSVQNAKAFNLFSFFTVTRTYIIHKKIQIILRLFLVIAMNCQTSSSQFFSITQPLAVLAGWEGSLGTCSR